MVLPVVVGKAGVGEDLGVGLLHHRSPGEAVVAMALLGGDVLVDAEAAVAVLIEGHGAAAPRHPIDVVTHQPDTMALAAQAWRAGRR
jgi:hypothetical protein